MRKNKEHKKTLTTVFLLIVLIFAGFFALRTGYDHFMKRMYPLKFSEIITPEAQKNGLNPALVYSVVKAESGFNPEAKSRAGAVGLMQLTPDTFDWLRSKDEEKTDYAARDLYTPAVNVRYGCSFLALLLDKYGSTRTALCAYNAGIGTVNGWLKDPSVSKDGKSLDTIPYGETERYVAAVLENYENYKKLYQF